MIGGKLLLTWKGPGKRNSMHYNDTFVYLIVLQLANWRGSTTKKDINIFITKYKQIMIIILLPFFLKSNKLIILLSFRRGKQ